MKSLIILSFAGVTINYVYIQVKLLKKGEDPPQKQVDTAYTGGIDLQKLQQELDKQAEQIKSLQQDLLEKEATSEKIKVKCSTQNICDVA